jgi:hypothetical protein
LPTRHHHRSDRRPPAVSAFAGFRFPAEVIVVAVRWYLRYGSVALADRKVRQLPGGVSSDGSSQLGERRGELGRGRGVDPEFVVAASQVLDEGVPGDDDLCRPFGLQSAHWSEAALSWL